MTDLLNEAAETGPLSSSNNDATSAEEVDEDEDDKSSSFADLAPKMRAQFANLSSTLMETHDNLHTFEFMLTQYRQMAKIQPLTSQANTAMASVMASHPQLQDNPNMSAAQTEKIESLLSDLNSAVGKLAVFKDQVAKVSESSLLDESPSNQRPNLEAENERLKAEISNLNRSLAMERDENANLRSKLTSEAARNEQLMESVHRARKSLDEERTKNLSLDQKLDNERKAARKVGEDITRYVEQMKTMEDEVRILRKESKSNNSHPQNVQVSKESRIEAKSNLEAAKLKQRLEAEVEKTSLLEAKVKKYESQIKDYESQLHDLKRGLETLQIELEKYQNAGLALSSSSPPVASAPPPKEDIDLGKFSQEVQDDSKVEELEKQIRLWRARCKKNESDLRGVRASSRTLLAKYEEKKSKLSNASEKMRKAKAAVTEIMRVSSKEEKNFRAIIGHLGGEIEVAARLMGSYLNLEINHPTVSLRSRKDLSSWFRNVQSLSTWLKNQIAAFGARYWTKMEAISKEVVIPYPTLEGYKKRNSVSLEEELPNTDRSLHRMGTVSEISESLDDHENTEEGEENEGQQPDSILELIEEQSQYKKEKSVLFSRLVEN